MKKSVSCFVAVLVFLSGVATFASTEQERRIEYSLTAINNVVTMQNWMGEIYGSWYTNVSVPFVGGIADSTIGLAYGPSLYNASANWEDANGFSLFSSYGSIKKIEAGMNYMDFPMYLSYWRDVRISFKQPITAGNEIWVNGGRAWFDGTYWWADIEAPWNVTALTIVWSGHGQWVLPASPSFNYGQTVALSVKDMDPSVKTPSQAFGLTYLGETSYPTQQMVFVTGVEYDQSLGLEVLTCSSPLYQSYGPFKVMVALEYYDPNLGNMVQYFSRYVDVSSGTFLIPLLDSNGENLGIQDGTFVRFIYQDPSDGKTCKQQWDGTLYTSPSNGGGKG